MKGSGARVMAVMTHHSERHDATCKIAALPSRPASGTASGRVHWSDVLSQVNPRRTGG